jgi:predicted transcriptional regulator
LSGASLLKVSLQQANLTGANVYGVAAWDLQTDGLQQNDLIVIQREDALLTVDNIELAQFVYLMHKNEKLRNIIDTITSKAVLILGRFTSERKRVLDALREALRTRNYVPIIFDFEPSGKRDLTETAQLLANMAKFVIADITEAKSIPQELSHIIPLLPSVPVQPILLASDRGYAMFEHWRGFNSVLPEFLYENEQHLLNNLDAKLIGPVNTWQKKQNKVAALEEKIKEEQNRVAALEEKIKELEAKHAQ